MVCLHKKRRLALSVHFPESSYAIVDGGFYGKSWLCGSRGHGKPHGSTSAGGWACGYGLQPHQVKGTAAVGCWHEVDRYASRRRCHRGCYTLDGRRHIEKKNG